MIAELLQPLPGHPDVDHVSLRAADAAFALGGWQRVPFCTRALAENVLRHVDDPAAQLASLLGADGVPGGEHVEFRPARILLQDASGIPVVADLVATIDHADGRRLRVDLPMDLVVDHSLEVDRVSVPDAAEHNLAVEYRRNAARYRFLKWAAGRLPTLRVFPPGSGICHQLNLEVISQVVRCERPIRGRRLALFDSVVGTDSHTTMINALSVCGWGVGGIEAVAVALGSPALLPRQRVVGVRLTGALRAGALAADVALALTASLRAHGVVQKIVEFTGPAVARLSLGDRATIANMAPEYGATMAFFPPDRRTLQYLADTGRNAEHIDLAEDYLRAQGCFVDSTTPTPDYDEDLEFDLSTVHRLVAGPSRPDQTLTLSQLPVTISPESSGRVLVASISSCTNTANPRAMVAAGLLARAARRRGLRPPSWIKRSLTPGTRAVADLLQRLGLQDDLDRLGFAVAGFGCGTCVGNGGELPLAAAGEDPPYAAVLSGNRNFPGRLHRDIELTYLCSPPLVVAFALAGTVRIDLEHDLIGTDLSGQGVRLADLWPSTADIDQILATDATGLRQLDIPASLAERWAALGDVAGECYPWDGPGGLIRRPVFADPEMTEDRIAADLIGTRPLLVLGDDVTTDHISPVGPISPDSGAAAWLRATGVSNTDLGTYARRRLDHDVMVRGAFANPRLRNAFMCEDSPFQRAQRLTALGHGLVIVAGARYGTGSARDWAAKAPRLLGVRAVIAASFERIHRMNLVGMGILPIVADLQSLHEFNGSERLDITGIGPWRAGRDTVTITIRDDSGPAIECRATPAVHSPREMDWLAAGGIIPYLISNAPRQGSAHTN